MTTRRLTCSCCGEDAGRWQQHWNRDTGYGVCRKCITGILKDTPADELASCYGIAGINYADSWLCGEDPQDCGARVIVKRASREVGGPLTLDSTPMQVESWARANLDAVAIQLRRWFERAAKAWVDGNNSGSAKLLKAGDVECDRLRFQAERLLGIFGVWCRYPGLYPTYHTNKGGHWQFGQEANAMANEAVVTIELKAK
jgi:hypothetical protein